MTKPSACVLVDVQNLYYTARSAFKDHIDYNALWAYLQANYRIDTAIAYAIDRGDPKQQQFQNILRAIGFEVKLKPFVQRRDGSAKGDWDVGIAIDAIEYAKQVSHVVLCSGDGDFAILCQHLQQKYDCKIEVISTEILTAQALIECSNCYTAISGQFLMNSSA